MAVQLDSDGNQIGAITLPDHYMSGIAFDNSSFWVATYYPDPGTIYQINQNGDVISQISSPDEQPWDISLGDTGLWVADYWGDAIYEIDKNDGTTINSYASEGVDPAGVVWDGNYLWYCDNGPNYDIDLLYQIDIFGSGTPEINLSTSSVNFGDVGINSTAEYILNVSNLGEGDLILESGNIFNSSFSLNSSFPITLLTGEDIDITISFTPDVIGSYSGSLSLISNDPITPVASVSLAGYGMENEQEIQPEYLELNLGEVRIHALTSRSLNIYNAGSSALTIESIDFTLDNFYLDNSINLPLTVLSLDNVDIRYWFSADSYGTHSTEMQIVSNDADEAQVSVSLEAVVVEFDSEIGSEFWSFQSNSDQDKISAVLPFVDLNGDNVEEILVADDNYSLYCINGNSSGTADIIWHLNLYIPSIGAGSVYDEKGLTIMDDINSDGVQDIALGTVWGSRSVFAVSGMDGSIIWHYDTDEYGDGGWVYEVDAEHDFNNDGIRDILAVSGDDGSDFGPRRVQLFNGLNGNKIWEHPFYNAMTAVISMDDINGDAIPDVVCGSSPDNSDAIVYVLDGSTGNIINQINSNSMAVWGLCPINDINNDGLMDYAYGDFNGAIKIVTSPADVTASFSTQNGLITHMESITAYNQKSYILSGTLNDYFPLINATDGTVSWAVTTDGFVLDASPIEDINGDLFFDVLIGTLDEKLSVLSGLDGQEIFSKNMYHPVEQTSSITDLDNNSTPEILVGLRNGKLFCYSGGDANEDAYLEGDINLDGLVNILDIILVVNIILGNYEANELELWLADVNLDGSINILDIIALVNVILGS